MKSEQELNLKKNYLERQVFAIASFSSLTCKMLVFFCCAIGKGFPLATSYDPIGTMKVNDAPETCS